MRSTWWARAVSFCATGDAYEQAGRRKQQRKPSHKSPCPLPGRVGKRLLIAVEPQHASHNPTEQRPQDNMRQALRPACAALPRRLAWG